MTAQDRFVNVIGVSVFGPPPLTWAHIPLESGVLALYGKNGVGKTRLLNACTDALRGVQRPGQFGLVHVWADPDGFREPGWHGYVEAQGRVHLAQVRGQRLAQLVQRKDDLFELAQDDDDAIEEVRQYSAVLADEEFSPYMIKEVVREQIAMLISDTRGDANDWLAGHGAAILDEVMSGGLLTLIAIGSPGRPQWTVFGAGSTRGTAFAAFLIREQQAYAHLATLNDAARRGTPAKELNDLLKHAKSPEFPWNDVEPLRNSIVTGEYPPGTERYIDENPGSLDFDWPDWAGIPMCKIAEIDHLPLVLVDEALDPNTATRERMLAITDRVVLSAVADDEVIYSDAFTGALDTIGATASDIAQATLGEELTLRFDPGRPNEWFAGVAPCWSAQIGPRAPFIALEALSAAQRRWSTLAIAIALQASDPASGKVVFLCDEPEGGLHRAAERRLPSALRSIADRANVAVVAATHSPAMLNDLGVRLRHVARPDGSATRVTPLALSVADEFSRAIDEFSLGLQPADILQLVRVFVIVEGQHDKVALDHLLRSDLEAASAKVIPSGGGPSIPSVAQASVLWDFTDASFVIVLDNIADAAVSEIWRRAVGAAKHGDRRGAREILRELERLKGGEPRWLRELLDRVITQNRWNRVTPAPLSEPDIICYLPPDSFVPGKTWDDLKSGWRQHYEPQSPKDLKHWLKEKYGASTGTHAIKRAVQSAVPTREIQDLGMRIQEVSTGHSDSELQME